MKIKIVSPGRIKEKWLSAGIEEYRRRLGRYCDVEIITVPDMPDSWPDEKALAAEAEKILARIDGSERVIALDLHGQEYDSISFAGLLQEEFIKGGSKIVFVIGGSNGLDRQILARSNMRVSFSKLTFTHQFARLILLEQCYRAFRINNGEPYHK